MPPGVMSCTWLGSYTPTPQGYPLRRNLSLSTQSGRQSYITPWGAGLLGVVTSLARRTTAGFESLALHQVPVIIT